MNEAGFNKELFEKFASNLPPDFRLPKTAVERKIFAEYGALFVARGGASAPDAVFFQSEEDVSKFQRSVKISKLKIGAFEIELQAAAAKSLKKAIKEAAKNNRSITPRGADSARRNYRQTVELWASRVNPALIHWTKEGKLTETEAGKIRSLPPLEQVEEVLRLEENEIFFSKDLRKSILYSVAPPGASQHLAMLALDIDEFNDKKVREILAEHFWFQTVISDLPHFTFLGASESDLSAFGLKRIEDGKRAFWIPNL